ncbi:MAG TPA: hypothetical protein VMZ91_10620 [Candidatus Paceibacterota bacterium]|nr:hypothetical protein [Candidatus Paceibacterota bacterium]
MSEKIIITCLKELNERKYLEIDDIVKFTIKENTITYTVRSAFLKIFNGKNNDEIFRILDLDKDKLAERIYGYKRSVDYPGANYWPEIEMSDFPALTRLVRELYTIIEEKDKVYTKYNRFEIMDI